MSSVVGVDLGYQNSLIAAAGRGGVDVILNGNSNRLNPTMVGFDTSRKMGEHATSGISSNFRNTVYAMKRLVGLAFDDPRAKAEMKHVPVQFVPISHPSGQASIGVQVSLNGEDKILPIEAIYGMMVKHLGHIAAQKAASSSSDGTPSKNNTAEELYFPQDWVLAIPNYYTDAQRRAVLAGCDMVGIKSTSIQRLMHENTATALAYGIFKDLKKEFNAEKPTNVMFIDMGASAYTVSIVSFVPGKLIVKSVHFDPDLGGRDFDIAIAEWVSGKFEEKYKGKLSGKPLEKPKPRLKLLTACEKAKKTLSPQGVNLVQINVEMLLDDYDFQITLKADEYEKLCEPLLARLQAPIDKCLQEAGLTSKDLASAEVVGGSTRIGCVKRKLQSILGGGCLLSTTMNADEAVARGCALQSAILSPRFKVLPYDIQESVPFPVKISWQDDAQASGMEVDHDAGGVTTATDSVVMFDRGLNFPIVRRVTLRRAGEFAVRASYDESAVQQYGLPTVQVVDICSFNIQSVPEEKKVRVNVKQDIHGIVHLSSAQMVEEVEEEGTSESAAAASGGENKEGGEEGAEKKKKIKKTNLEFTTSRPLELTRDEVNRAHELEVAMANNDRVVKETADKRNELESYIYDMRDKVTSGSQLGPYGTEEEKAAFLEKNDAMENWLYGDGFDANKSVLAEKLAELKKCGAPMEMRQSEAQARPAATSALKNSVESYQQWVNDSQTDERYAHITDEEREKVRSLTDSISSWMYDMLDKQGSLALNQDPVITVAAIKAKHLELTSTCSPIQNKPMPKKPKEVPKEEPKKEDPPAATTSTTPEPMDVASENGDPEKMEVEA